MFKVSQSSDAEIHKVLLGAQPNAWETCDRLIPEHIGDSDRASQRLL